MNVAKDPLTMDTKCAQVIENMEFNAEGEKLQTRRGLGKPIYTFTADICYIWYDYELNSYLIFLKDKGVYTYKYGKAPVFIGKLTGSTETHPQIARYTNANGTYLLIASNGTLQSYEYSGSTINTSDSYPVCDTIMERSSRILVSSAGNNNIKYSGIGDPFNWTENSNDPSAMKDLDVGDVSGIGGIYPLAGEIIVFKKNGNIYRVANEPEDWNVTLVGKDSDFISRAAMSNLGEDVVYFSRQGLRSLSTSETYGNFRNEEIGEAMNPEMKKDTSDPWIARCPRMHELLINPNSGNIVYAYNYQLQAFTKWIFPGKIESIAEGMTNTLVGCGKELFNLSSSNHTDVVGGKESKIHQRIVAKRIVDYSTMTLYRSHLMVESADAGTAKLSVNDVTWDWNWTKDKQKEEFKTQIRSDDMTFTFETDDIITWKFWVAILVQQYVTMTSDGTSSGSGGSWSKSGSSKKKSSWGQGTFSGATSEAGGSPYG